MTAAAKPGAVTWSGLALVAAAAAILTFTTLRDLALACGITGSLLGIPLAWLLPITVDAAGAVAIRVWLTRQAASEATELARRLSWSCIALSIIGNAGQHGMAAYAIAPPWWVIVLVSSVPPAMFGATVHLAVLMGRPSHELPSRIEGSTDESESHTEAEPAPVSTPVSAPSAQTPSAQTPLLRAVPAAVAKPTELRAAVTPEPRDEKLVLLRDYQAQHPDERLTQRRVISLCRVSNARAKDLLTTLENSR